MPGVSEWRRTMKSGIVEPARPTIRNAIAHSPSDARSPRPGRRLPRSGSQAQSHLLRPDAAPGYRLGTAVSCRLAVGEDAGVQVSEEVGGISVQRAGAGRFQLRAGIPPDSTATGTTPSARRPSCPIPCRRRTRLVHWARRPAPGLPGGVGAGLPSSTSSALAAPRMRSSASMAPRSAESSAPLAEVARTIFQPRRARARSRSPASSSTGSRSNYVAWRAWWVAASRSSPSGPRSSPSRC